MSCRCTHLPLHNTQRGTGCGGTSALFDMLRWSCSFILDPRSRLMTVEAVTYGLLVAFLVPTALFANAVMKQILKGYRREWGKSDFRYIQDFCRYLVIPIVNATIIPIYHACLVHILSASSSQSLLNLTTPINKKIYLVYTAWVLPRYIISLIKTFVCIWRNWWITSMTAENWLCTPYKIQPLVFLGSNNSNFKILLEIFFFYSLP